MLQARLIDREKIVLENVEIPKIADRQVLINIKVCGVCGSDIHFYKDRHPFIHPRMVLGHEFSGVVSKIGNKVDEIQIGDKVTVEPIIACGECYNCLRNRHDICLKLQFIGAFGYNGGFAEYVVVPADIIVKVPDDMSFEDAALIEPLAVGVHAVKKRSGLRLGDKAIVMGAGTIGLSTMQAIKSAGASDVITVDPIEYRLKVASKLGSDETAVPEMLEKVISEKWGHDGAADVIFDCAGTEGTLSSALKLARPGTKIVMIACPEKKLSTEVILIQNNELELIGSVTYVRDDILTALDLVSKNIVNVSGLVTHRFKLEEIERAFKIMLNRDEEIIKALIVI